MKWTVTLGKILSVWGCLSLFLFSPALPGLHNLSPSLCGKAFAADDIQGEEEPFATEAPTVPDPLESMNRAFFKFNDKLYFWVLKPGATVYAGFIPQGVRQSIHNAYDNVLFPVRFVNCALQGKFEAAGTETARFIINSTMGFGGMFEVANRNFGIAPHDEDLGQTLGFYGMKPLVYFNWPVLGPSTVRDTLGTAGDTFLNPLYYLSPEYYVSAAIRAGTITNSVSLRLGEYEDFKKSAVDPYIALRDAYIQNRAKEIKE